MNALAPGYLEKELDSYFWQSDADKAMMQRISQRRLGFDGESWTKPGVWAREDSLVLSPIRAVNSSGISRPQSSCHGRESTRATADQSRQSLANYPMNFAVPPSAMLGKFRPRWSNPCSSLRSLPGLPRPSRLARDRLGKKAIAGFRAGKWPSR